MAADTATVTGAPTDAVAQRVAETLCEREKTCERVGKDKPWESGAACIDALRPRARQDLSKSGCPDDFDPNAVASCVSELRLVTCEKRIDGLASLTTKCEPRSLCVPR